MMRLPKQARTPRARALNSVEGVSTQSNLAASKKAPSFSKFGNRWTKVDGINFQSRREAMHWLVLKDRLRCGEIEQLERQVRYDHIINGVLICFSKWDFRYVVPGQGYVIEDAKGYKTDDYVIKRKLMKAIYAIDVREV